MIIKNKNEIVNDILFWMEQKRWLILISILGIIMFYLPCPENISIIGYRTIILVLLVVLLIITEPIPLPALALLIAILQVTFNIATPTEVARTFMNDSVFFIMGSLMMAVAIVQQGLDNRLALGLIRITGNSVNNIVLGFTLLSALLSSFIGEHTVVALMLPVGLSIIRNCNQQHSIKNLTALILFSIGYGATVGSIGTPSGGARNALMLEYWKTISNGNISISYLQWMILAYPMVIIGMLGTALLLPITFKPEIKQLDTSIRKLKIQVAHKGSIKGSDLMTIIIFVFIFLCWIFLHERYGLGIIAISGAFLYMVFGLIEWKDLNKHTNWGVILLFAAAISLGVQMKNTGAAFWIGNIIISNFSNLINENTILPYIVNILLTTFFSNIMSSSATVAVLGPITLNMGGDVIYMGMTTAIASAFGYFSVEAAPACMIIYSSGLIKISDFIRAGWRMGIMSISTLLLIYKFYWPLVINLINY